MHSGTEGPDRERLLELVRLIAAELGRASGGGALEPAPESELLALCAASFGMGLVRGRWGRVAPLGIPFDLGLGALLHVVGSSGLSGSQTRTMRTVARAALATYCATWGASVGNRLKLGLPVMSGNDSPRPSGTHAVDDAPRPSNGVDTTPNNEQVLESIRSIVMN